METKVLEKLNKRIEKLESRRKVLVECINKHYTRRVYDELISVMIKQDILNNRVAILNK